MIWPSARLSVFKSISITNTNSVNRKSAGSLPGYLRRFRAGSVYARMLETGAEALRTGHNVQLAKKAVLVLQKQNTYLPHHAGRWAVLLATILQVNCKDNAAVSTQVFERYLLPLVFFAGLIFRVAVISVKNHKRQRRKRQSVTAKREKSQTPKVLTAILTLPNLA